MSTHTHVLSWSDFVTTTMSEVGGDEGDDRTCEVAVVTLLEYRDIEWGCETLSVVDGDGQDMESEGIYTEVEDRLLRRFGVVGVDRSLTEVVTPW